MPDGVDAKVLDHIAFLEIDRTISFPRGADRVVFWETNLEKADRWLKTRKHNTVGNSTALIEGLRKEFAPILPRPPSLYSEVFVDYTESGPTLSPSLVAAVLLRESLEFSTRGKIISSDLNAIIEALRKCPLSRETTSCKSVVFSEDFTQDADLLVTTDTVKSAAIPSIVVARWGAVCLWRIGDNSASALKIVHHWKEVPESGAFVWEGDGSSGAAASLFLEKGQTVISYPSSEKKMVGQEKRMRHNFLLKGPTEVRHGVWVDVEQDDESSMKTTSFVRLRITKPGVLDSLEWVAIDPEQYPVELHTATLNFRDIMRATGMLREQNLSLGQEFSGYHTLQKRRVFGLSFNALATNCCEFLNRKVTAPDPRL